jgi:predicted transcriptional regulator
VKVSEIIDPLGLTVAAGQKALDQDIKGGYCGDLLSDVMANADKGSVWLTIQGHQNIVAVAVLRELAAVIIVNNRALDEDTKAKAEDEGIPVLQSQEKAFELAGRLAELGIGSIKP